jgi:hypothetical protein
VVGPLLMSIGDLLHPEERMSPVEQIAIVVDHTSRWYTAHLLLFFGILLFIPGFLGLTGLTAMAEASRWIRRAHSHHDWYRWIRCHRHR